jgi:hypothetical protein
LDPVRCTQTDRLPGSYGAERHRSPCTSSRAARSQDSSRERGQVLRCHIPTEAYVRAVRDLLRSLLPVRLGAWFARSIQFNSFQQKCGSARPDPVRSRPDPAPRSGSVRSPVLSRNVAVQDLTPFAAPPDRARRSRTRRATHQHGRRRDLRRLPARIHPRPNRRTPRRALLHHQPPATRTRNHGTHRRPRRDVETLTLSARLAQQLSAGMWQCKT